MTFKQFHELTQLATLDGPLHSLTHAVYTTLKECIIRQVKETRQTQLTWAEGIRGMMGEKGLTLQRGVTGSARTAKTPYVVE
jgi:hypothetical protein